MTRNCKNVHTRRSLFFTTLVFTGILLGIFFVLSCTSAGHGSKSGIARHLPDSLRKARWQESEVSVSALPGGVVIKVYDPASHAYRVAGIAPSVITWIHHCAACNDPEPVAPVILEYGGVGVSVIPGCNWKGNGCAIDADFSGGEPFVRKGILYNPKIVAELERLAGYRGGEDAFQDFIMHALYYPAPAWLKGIEGNVFASFVVEQDGSLSNLQILRGIGGGCDEEVLDIIRLMPRWIPGTSAGKPVRSRHTMVISFSLKSQDHVKSVYYWK
ncbi:MAG: energy transducer TonB [Bacteroidota bacterium]